MSPITTAAAARYMTGIPATFLEARLFRSMSVTVVPEIVVHGPLRHGAVAALSCAGEGGALRAVHVIAGRNCHLCGHRVLNGARIPHEIGVPELTVAAQILNRFDTDSIRERLMSLPCGL